MGSLILTPNGYIWTHTLLCSGWWTTTSISQTRLWLRERWALGSQAFCIDRSLSDLFCNCLILSDLFFGSRKTQCFVMVRFWVSTSFLFRFRWSGSQSTASITGSSIDTSSNNNNNNTLLSYPWLQAFSELFHWHKLKQQQQHSSWLPKSLSFIFMYS